MASEIIKLSNYKERAISCFALKGNTHIAIVPNSNIAEIYKISSSDPDTWVLDSTLTSEHTQIITCIDWAPNSNRILTCSQDRNAHVWIEPTGKEKEWKPQIVLLRFKMAATYCAWSPDEKKIAVGGSENDIAVGYYDTNQSWWVCKKLKGNQSAIQSLSWHPSGVALASVGLDPELRICPTIVQGAGDQKSVTVPVFGQVEGCTHKKKILSKIFRCGWATCVAFSPSGNRILVCFRDSSVSIVHLDQGDANDRLTHTVNLSGTHFISAIFANENTIIGAGFDPEPSQLRYDDGKKTWAFVQKLKAITVAAPKSGFVPGASKPPAAMRMFTNLSTTGTIAGVTQQVTRGEGHLSVISKIAPWKRVGPNVTEVISSGLDGQILFWGVV